MCKRFLTLILVISITIQLMVSYKTFALDNQQPKKRILVVYDRKTYFSYENDISVTFCELLGHFNVTVNKEDETQYKASEISNYDYVFIIGIEGDFTNKTFLYDLSHTDKTICWIGKGVEKYLVQRSDLGLTYGGEAHDITDVYYTNKSTNSKSLSIKKTKYSLANQLEFTILNVNTDGVAIYSYITDGANNYPYILNKNNFWYVSIMQDDGILFYILSDVLYNVLNVVNTDVGRVFIRIEDVHPFRDTKELRKIAEYLHSKNIPFMIALIPFYKNPINNYLTPMSDIKDFVQTIKYMQALGGSVILHGVTHAGYGGETTGEGYEFWDGINNKPLQVNMKTYVYNKIGSGLTECIKNGIYPLAFESPHYAMDSRGYTEIKKYFSTYIGNFQSNDVSFSTVTYPYNLYSTTLFNKFIPENLGYVQTNDKFSVNRILDNFDKVSIVRGYTAGVFFHPYLDIKYLKQIVQGLEKRRVNFYDLKGEVNWVKWHGIKIESKNDKIIATPKVQNQAKIPVPSKPSIVSKINNVLIVIIGAFCSVFLLIWFLSNKRNKKRFLR